MTGAGSDPTGSSTRVGVVGGTRDASVDGRGALAPRAAGWELGWWIGADDRWRIPAREVALRQHLVDGMPVVETAMRVPSGDAVQRVYGVPRGDAGELCVVEITNDSPTPFVVALVVRGASAVDLHGATVYADGRTAIRTSRPPSRWAMSSDGTTEDLVTRGAASDAPFAPRRDRGARLVAAFLYPVAHRTTLRAAVALGTRGLGGVSPAELPDAADVARGWRAQLARGCRMELPDEQLQGAVDTARAATVLAGQAWRVTPEVAAALEDWGLDAEAAVAWSRLTGRARRRLRRREPAAGSWGEVFARVARADEQLLASLRAVVARERDDGIALLEDWPREWIGRPLDVRDAPTRRGGVSCSVRWHGDRPALLWDGPDDSTFTAPGLDPGWSSDEPRGEALLSPVAGPR